MGAPNLDDVPQPDLTDFFRSCSIFDGANSEALDFAAANSELLSFRQGDSIILENEANSSVHFVVQGSVEIATYLTEEKRVQRLLLLQTGSHFGEFSVLTRSARSGSAYAFTDCLVMKMPGTSFLSMLESFPNLALNLLGTLARFSQASLGANEFVPFHVGGAQAPSAQILQILPQMSWKKLGVVPVGLKAGVLSVVVRDPHHGALYSHLSSAFPKLEVSVSIAGEREFNLLLEQMATAAVAPVVRPAPRGEIDFVESLKKASLFSGFSDERLAILIPRLKLMTVKAGELVLTAGQLIEEGFMILRGSVQLSRPIRGSSAKAPVLVLREGESFGDEQVFLAAPSPCACRAMEDADLLVIPKEVLGELLQDPTFVMSLVREFALRLQTLGHISGLRYISAEAKFDFAPMASLFPLAIIDDERMIPLKIEDGELSLGFVSPESSGTLLKIDRYLADYRVRIVGLTEDQFRNFRAALRTLQEASSKPTTAAATAEKPDVLKWLSGILADGYRTGASDIHLEPGVTGLTARFRIDGVLREHGRKLPPELITQAIGRLKVVAGMDISINQAPQDANLETEAENLKVMARMSTLPIKQGEKVVLRLIREKNSVVPLEMIAPDRRIVRLLKSVTERRQGLFLVTGPTGSGKTTTLYSLLKLINQVDVNVISIEDPVEMELRGVNQVEINAKRGLEFSAALKSVLRQDPDVMMVGEIRDAESARVVFDAAMTGCLVLSTLHSGTSLDAVPRLKDLGISPAQIAEGLVGVITQRLVRSVCKHCARSHPITDHERQLFAPVPHVVVPDEVKRGDGCQACSHTGYSGRLPVFETWATQRTMGDAIREGQSTATLEAIARGDGFESLFEYGLRLVQSGSTTPEEIRRVLTGTGSLF